MSKTIKDIQSDLRDFAGERDWEQFHSPKNLSMALSVEVSELQEHFQWLTEEQSYLKDNEAVKDSVQMELADVFLYLVRLSDQLGIDIIDSAKKKMKVNAEKYPVELCKGKSLKYNKL